MTLTGKVWHSVCIFACFGVAIETGAEWYHGKPADWFVWSAAIYAMIMLGLESIRSLTSTTRAEP
jgi:hypothetical protein